VSPESRNVFALRAARAANVVHGIPVKFRGQDIRACLAPIAIGLDLDTGGLKQGGEFKCRFLAESLDSPPRRGESVLHNGRTYLVTEITQQTTITGEHVVTLTPGSAQ
jgi:hypothetical protein